MQLDSPISVHPIPIYQDNYVWVMRHTSQNSVVVVDPGSASEVIEYITQHELTIASIIITHSHWDHVTGIAELCANLQLWRDEEPVVYGSSVIQDVTHPVEDGDRIELCKGLDVPSLQVIATPGHMPEHLTYLLPLTTPKLFCGDTLFSCGCGRILQGTHEQLRTSLDAISALPSQTEVYCTHEYTLANIKFARAVEPQSQALIDYEQRVRSLRENDQPSIPTTIEREKALNPFLRYKELSVQQAVENHLQLKGLTAADVFKQLRLWKDSF
ncbi:hydroxyacylglutathione hydrolase [Saccharophagus degradans]|uniref:Hydroxyacylglutathione hydrolase n=1 Tax=Saccharophagus degradans TaxID=86304 RepID=A0AAW7X066_9GAMM|nr:hydroxyacylglutathione hydrolase [Saccharophagus degradans]MDO6421176.1 hydroxyacylglutathione hydrolase [Saccharophagus degradans]MDO6605913.1 hydroxyacylglutathione hydrolase [Saccharophagus degradans]